MGVGRDPVVPLSGFVRGIDMDRRSREIPQVMQQLMMDLFGDRVGGRDR